jgi:hypothetical protein
VLVFSIGFQIFESAAELKTEEETMRFGAFEYPDFFVFEKLTAICLECEAEMSGQGDD